MEQLQVDPDMAVAYSSKQPQVKDSNVPARATPPKVSASGEKECTIDHSEVNQKFDDMVSCENTAPVVVRTRPLPNISSKKPRKKRTNQVCGI